MFHRSLAVFLEIENLVESRILSGILSVMLSGKYIGLCGYELKFAFLNIHLLALLITFV